MNGLPVAPSNAVTLSPCSGCLVDSVHGVDIETDNSAGNGLDPARSQITEIAVSTPGRGAGQGVVFSGESEAQILTEFETWINDTPPGVLATWNGAFFDWPFIADRVKVHRQRSGLFNRFGLRMRPAPTLRPKYAPLPGHATPQNPGGGYEVWWEKPGRPGPAHGHRHIDVAETYREVADRLGVPWSLKPVCRGLGISMVELDRQRLHQYSQAERRTYCLSDANGTRLLLLRSLDLDPETLHMCDTYSEVGGLS